MSETPDPDIDAIQRIGAVPTVLRVVGEMTGLRLALVARVTDNMWKACAVHDRMEFGLHVGGRLDVATTLCAEVRDTRAAVIMDCASKDPVYRDHRTPKMYGFESYVSVPIFLQDGEYFGTLCALDSQARPLKDGRTLPMMTMFAELISFQLAAEERQQRAVVDLHDAREASELREQFIAVLGHDLRTPLSAMVTGAELLTQRLDGPDRGIAQRIRASGARISRLVDDVLDFARGRLGGGISLAPADVPDLDAVFQQVIDELRQAYPGRSIRVTHGAVRAFRGDRERLAQLLSNLVANALEHGLAGEPVEVELRDEPHALTLAVTNRGEPITDATLPLLFEPYRRGESSQNRSGLGLGLYIVAEIARSHGGRVEVRSTRADGTTFTCILPRL